MNVPHTRARIFEEMGIGPEWVLRGPAEEGREPAAKKVVRETTAPQPVAQPPADSAPVAPVPAKTTIPAAIKPAEEPVRRLPQPAGNFADWAALNDAIQHCTRCDLCKTRTNTVPGVGDTSADWLFIGEGPGYHEDQQGEPFVGRSGQLLDNMLAALGIARGSNAYIANIVKCRASDAAKKDRQPTEEEAAACLPYLQWQIEKIAPKVIVALGKTAAVTLLNTDRNITMNAMRGRVHRLAAGEGEIPLIVTYHPAYLLRTLMAKKQAWADLCLAMDVVEGV